MAQAQGSNSAVTLFEESTYGTTPGTPDGKKLYYTAFNLSSNQNLMDSNTLTGARERSRPVQANINVSGNLRMEIGAESIGTLMKHAIGSTSTTGAGPYTHVITPSALPTSLVLEKDFGSAISGSGRYEYFNGCRIRSLNLDFPTDGFCTADFTITGSKSTLAASPLDASITDYGHTSFSSFQASIQEGGGAIAVVTQASIQIDNDLDESVFVIGGAGVRAALPEGFSTVSGSITALFDSASLLNKAIAGTQSSLKITLSRGTGLGSAGNESIEFFVQQLMYQRASPAVEGPRGIMITLPFKGYKSGATNALQVTVKNAVATI